MGLTGGPKPKAFQWWRFAPESNQWRGARLRSAYGLGLATGGRCQNKRPRSKDAVCFFQLPREIAGFLGKVSWKEWHTTTISN